MWNNVQPDTNMHYRLEQLYYATMATFAKHGCLIYTSEFANTASPWISYSNSAHYNTCTTRSYN